MENIRLEIASPPDRERLVAQVIIGNEQFAEINQESDTVELEIYPRQNGKAWILSLDTVMQVFAEARKRLLAHS